MQNGDGKPPRDMGSHGIFTKLLMKLNLNVHLNHAARRRGFRLLAGFLFALAASTHAAPTNDNFAARAPLPPDVTQAEGDNTAATREPGEPVHSPDPSGVAGGRSIWWRWTPQASGTVTINTVGSHLPGSAVPLMTQLGVYTGSQVSSLAGTRVATDEHSAGNGWSVVTFNAQAGVQYKIAVDAVGGQEGLIELSFDQTGLTNQPPSGPRPVVTILSPVNGLRTTNAAISVQGTARGARSNLINQVVYQLNDGAFIPAAGTTNWQADIQLDPGTNVFRVKSIDQAGMESLVAERQFVFIFLSPLTLQTNGEGRISPANLNGTLQRVGSVIRLTAIPAAGSLFAGWTGSAQSDKPVLEFVMVPNAVLTANFVPNAFSPLRGVFRGLITGAPEVDSTNSGCITLVVANSGAFTARATVGAQTYPISGVFNPVSGQAAVSVMRGSNAIVTGNLLLHLSDGSQQVTGNLAGSNWTATVLADRGVFHSRTNLAPYAGRYTFVFNRNQTVNGFSYGQLRVDGAGNVFLVGRLADGTPISQATVVSQSGMWPLCLRLYGNRGLLLGWMRFNNEDFSSIQGNPINWIRPAIPGSRLYPDGFNLDLVAAGSLFIAPPARTPLFAWQSGVVELGGGNLDSNLVNTVIVNSNNVVTVNNNSNRVSLHLSSNGLLTGSFIHPNNRQLRPLQGVVLMKTNWAAGYFLGLDQSGYLTLMEDLTQGANFGTTPDSLEGLTLTFSPVRQTGRLQTLNASRLAFTNGTATSDVDSFGTATFNYSSDGSNARFPRVAELNVLHGKVGNQEVVLRVLLTFTSSTGGTYLAATTAGGEGAATGTFSLAPTP